MNVSHVDISTITFIIILSKNVHTLTDVEMTMDINYSRDTINVKAVKDDPVERRTSSSKIL